ncbi:MAG TPA: 2OG-Fe(II) oxygenase [Cytophagaceae bacterium]
MKMDAVKQNDVISMILDGLADRGFAIADQFLPDSILENLFEEQKLLLEEGRFKEAGIGRGSEHSVRQEIRGDKILWFDPENLSPFQEIYLFKLYDLKSRITADFFLSLNDIECHFAVYPVGSLYKRHLDQFKGVGARQISCILYLNKDWKEEDGGSLRIYYDVEDREKYIDVLPQWGRFVCFRSADIYHEVLKTNRERYSITAWMRK